MAEGEGDALARTRGPLAVQPEANTRSTIAIPSQARQLITNHQRGRRDFVITPSGSVRQRSYSSAFAASCDCCQVELHVSVG
jgi:hypothetical protein